MCPAVERPVITDTIFKKVRKVSNFDTLQIQGKFLYLNVNWMCQEAWFRVSKANQNVLFLILLSAVKLTTIAGPNWRGYDAESQSYQYPHRHWGWCLHPDLWGTITYNFINLYFVSSFSKEVPYYKNDKQSVHKPDKCRSEISLPNFLWYYLAQCYLWSFRQKWVLVSSACSVCAIDHTIGLFTNTRKNNLEHNSVKAVCYNSWKFWTVIVIKDAHFLVGPRQ